LASSNYSEVTSKVGIENWCFGTVELFKAKYVG